MTRHTGVLLALVATAAAGLQTPASSAQQPTFRAETDLVSLGVTVTDRRGAFLSNLTADDFEILEDGVRQTVSQFAGPQTGAGTGSEPDLHIGLLLDTSGSMERDIGLARSAAIRFLNTLRDAKDITLVDFDNEARVAKYGQQDFPRLVERIRARKAGGLTAMHDALGLYLDTAQEEDGRTVLVLFADGGDTRSSIRFNDVITLLRASDVTLYAIGFLENQGGGRLEQRSRLTQLSNESGGQAFFPLSMKEVESAYDKIVAQIRAQYTIGYLSTNAKADGTWRKVEIKVRGSASEPRIQARKGYFAPYRPAK